MNLTEPCYITTHIKSLTPSAEQYNHVCKMQIYTEQVNTEKSQTSKILNIPGVPVTAMLHSDRN